MAISKEEKARIARENGKKGGRPVGTTNRPKINEFVSREEIEKAVQYVLDNYRDKPDLLKWMLDQYFGKARQTLGMEGPNDGEPIVFQVDGSLYKKHNGVSQETEGGSGESSEVSDTELGSESR